jgi:enoyl-CoA hydratase
MIEREDNDKLVVLRMSHGKANALDSEFCRALIGTLDDLQTGDARPVVLTGSGKIFSAGVDLFRVVDGGSDYLDEFLPLLLEAFAKLFAFPRPLVAAVNGHAIAGGCVVACACDYRLMARGSGRVGVPELLVGVPFPTVALEILRFAVGNAHLQSVVYSGATFTPDEAVDRGLVDELCEEDDLAGLAAERAAHFASIPAPSYALAKRQLHQPVEARIRERGPTDDESVRAIWMDPKTLDNMRDYLRRTLGKKG